MNLFGFRHLQCGIGMRKTVVPSDSGYLTTEGSEKTIGDVNKSMFCCLCLYLIHIIVAGWFCSKLAKWTFAS